MYKQVEKELSEIKKPEEDRLKKAFERLDVDRDGMLLWLHLFICCVHQAHYVSFYVTRSKVRYRREICT